jgi:hypothetical protein
MEGCVEPQHSRTYFIGLALLPRVSRRDYDTIVLLINRDFFSRSRKDRHDYVEQLRRRSDILAAAVGKESLDGGSRDFAGKFFTVA